MVLTIRQIGESTTKVNPDGSVTLHIPIKMERKSGRTTIVASDGTKQKQASLRKLEQQYLSSIQMTPAITALVKAHQWKEEIMSGKVNTLTDIAQRENVSVSHVSRIYRLTLLAPDIIEAILDGTQPKTLTQQKLLKNFPSLWSEQRKMFGFGTAQR